VKVEVLGVKKVEVYGVKVEVSWVKVKLFE
jgi:hypothetical protein